MMAGDFNIIAHPSKSLSYNSFNMLNSSIKEFNECLQQLAVFDHSFNGPLFTWFNCQGEGFIANKLDGGPNGYIAHFFKVVWFVVGRDVVGIVFFYFFQTNDLSPAFNSTIVALVPKSNNPNSMKNFRPISCCSVIYKCITKIIVNTLFVRDPNVWGSFFRFEVQGPFYFFIMTKFRHLFIQSIKFRIHV